MRAELMNFFIRLVVSFNKLETDNGVINDMATTFEYLINLFITPVYENNDIHRQRALIRQSRKLNDLLYLNREGLTRAFTQVRKMNLVKP